LQRASGHEVRFVVGGGAVSGVVVADRWTAAGVAVAELEVAFGAIALGRQCRSPYLVVFSSTNIIVPRGLSVLIVVGIL